MKDAASRALAGYDSPAALPGSYGDGSSATAHLRTSWLGHPDMDSWWTGFPWPPFYEVKLNGCRESAVLQHDEERAPLLWCELQEMSIGILGVADCDTGRRTRDFDAILVAAATVAALAPYESCDSVHVGPT